MKELFQLPLLFFVLNKQINYSHAFRILWNNYNLIENKEYFKYLQRRFKMTDSELDSLVSDVKNKFKRTQTNKENTEIRILIFKMVN